MSSNDKGRSVPAPIDFLDAPSEPSAAPVMDAAPPAAEVSPVPSAEPEWNDTAPPPASDYLEADTGWAMRLVEKTFADLDETTQAMLMPDAVVAFRPGVDPNTAGLSPFEAHVAAFIDGGRPVARIAVKSGLSEADLRICLSMLADRGIIERAGTAVSNSPRTFTTGVRHKVLIDEIEAAVEEADDELDQAAAEETTPPPVIIIPKPDPKPTPAPAQAQAPAPASATGPDPFAPKASKTLVIDKSGKVRAVRAKHTKKKTKATKPEKKRKGVRPVAVTAKDKHAMKAWELAVADIEAGRMSRAIGHVRMASQLAPQELLYKAMLANWSNVKGVLSGEIPYLPGADGKVATPPTTSKEVPPAVRLYGEAVELEAKGDLPGARDALQRALQIEPKAARLHNKLGVLLCSKMNDHERGVSHLEQAVALDESNMTYSTNLAKMLARATGDQGPAAKKSGGLRGLFSRRS